MLSHPESRTLLGKWLRSCPSEDFFNRCLALLAEFDIPLEDPRVVLRKGTPAAAITEHVRKIDADCVIMGTLARKGILGLLIGNTAEQVLDSITCSVLTLKPEGFVTPVSESLLLSRSG
jgi:nucleotide-binding universal stress UspA family protein